MMLCQPKERRVLIRGNELEMSAVLEALRSAPDYEVLIDAVGHQMSDRVEIIILVAGGSSEAKELLRQTGSASRMPILVVCADSSPSAAVECLRGGADDYVVSPFDRWELLARMDRSIHRCIDVTSSSRAIPSGHVEIRLGVDSGSLGNRGPVVFHEHDWTVSIHSYVARLTEAQFRILAHLIAMSGRWVRTQSLQDRALASHATIGASNVRYHVMNARIALGPHAEHLHGWQRRGYMWSFKHCDTPHCISEERSRATTSPARREIAN
jgi:DNA-binding response OmpR family regulator